MPFVLESFAFADGLVSQCERGSGGPQFQCRNGSCAPEPAILGSGRLALYFGGTMTGPLPNPK